MKIFTIVGLSLNLFGSFLFSLSYFLSKSSINAISTPTSDVLEPLKEYLLKNRKIALIGLIFLVLGFAAQIIGEL